MDKVLSARVDEAVLLQIGALARKLNTTRKAVIERAISALADELEQEGELDVLEQTCGCWQRDELPEQTAQRARAAFRASMERHHR